jgi:pilus assembly protein CpaB
VRNAIALAIAVILGIIAVFGVVEYVRDQREELEKRFDPVKVAVAARRIMAGETITQKDIDPNGKVSSAELLLPGQVLQNEAYAVLVGKEINRNMERGEQFLLGYIRQPAPRMEDLLPPDERAATIAVDAISGVGGALTPGSYVDIFGTFQLSETGERVTGGAMAGRTVLLLSNVRVIAVGARTRENAYAAGGRRQAAYSTVTLSLTPEEVPLVVHARTIGDLTLALRSPAAAADVAGATPQLEMDAARLLDRARELNNVRRLRIEREIEGRIE